MSSDIDILATVPLFGFLDEKEREQLASRVELVTLTANTPLFAYGDPGDSMYVIKTGKVEISVKTKTGQKVVLQEMGPGDFFGEISLLDEGPRTASAFILEAGEALLVDRGDLDELIRVHPESALDMLQAAGRRMRQTSQLVRNIASRNVNEAVEDQRSFVMKAADGVAAFSGSLAFLFLHVGIFFFWIIFNVGLLPWGGFDKFPFGLLTMVVSLEAIMLSTLLLFSSNRQSERDRVNNDIEYDVNLKAELQIQHLHEKFDTMNAEILGRLAAMERHLPVRDPLGVTAHGS